MTTAGGIALIIIGAALKYAVTWRLSWISLDTLGTILMIGGAAGLLLGPVMSYTRRRRADRMTTHYVQEDQYYEDPPRP